MNWTDVYHKNFRRVAINLKVEEDLMKAFGSLLIFVVGIVFLSCGDRKRDGNKTDLINKQAISKEPDHPGKLVYMQFCLPCHMAKGEGVPGLYPPLNQTEIIAGDEERIIEIVLKGLEGPFTVKGEYYNNVMTKLDFLTDQQVAEVLSYVRSNFGNTYAPVSMEKVKEVRSKLLK
ncbi:MAG: cytochrome c [Cyclobacteriaceae bacterium]|nr:cytochrome c [Cyclobacteriaceae bacterium]